MRKTLTALVTTGLGVALAALTLPGSAALTSAQGTTSREAQATAAHAAFVKYMSSHQPLVRSGTTTAVKVHGAPSSLGSVNWSGYADVEAATNTVSSVTGSWTIPSVSCLTGNYRNQDAFLAQWIGIDGATNGTVEQLGTATQCYEGVEYYYDWYEMFPNGTIEEGTTQCIDNNVQCPRPGDRISASVTVTPGATGENNYTLALTDSSRPRESFSVSQSCATTTCLDQSAEWIIERPAFSLPFGFQILPLADFTKTGFRSGTVTSAGTTTDVGGFTDGPVYDVAMADDSLSYYLDCVGQHGPSGRLLLTSSATACPIVAPATGGGFKATWDSSF